LKMQKGVVQFLTTVFFLGAMTYFTADEPAHYCNDEAEWHKWKQIIKKYPTDDTLRTAYALRIGLCSEVTGGTIEIDKAITLFEKFMNAVKYETQVKKIKSKKLEPEKSI